MRTLLPTLVLVCLHTAAICSGEDFNPRWDFLRINLEVFPGMDRIFEPDWRLFWRLKANLSKIPAAEKSPSRDYPFRVSTEANGRRVSAGAPAGAPAVLFLGDSCTFGIPVNDDQAFPAQVGKSLGVWVINAGVPGYSAFQGRLLLEAVKENPKAVVVTFWVNDRTIWDNLSDREHFALMDADRKGEFSRHRLTRILRRATPGSRPRLSEEEFAEELTATVARARQIGAFPLLVIWPTARQIAGEPEDRRQSIIRDVGAKTKSTVVDLAPTFRGHNWESLFVDPVHATAKGYKIAAAPIAEALRDLLKP